MDVLHYRYDEPLGIYAHESHERLAKIVMAGFVRQEQAQVDAGFVESLGDSSNLITPMIDESRIGSLVESDDSYMGYGLLTPRFDREIDTELGGVWYQVKRDGDEPTVINSKYISFRRPFLMDKYEGQHEVEQLMFQFDKSQLETILRMLGKMTKRLEADRPSGMDYADRPPSLGWLQLISSEPVEPDVLYAIKENSLDDLNMLFPSQDTARPSYIPASEVINQPEELRHISEWTDFIQAANELIQSEADARQPESHVNIRHEIGSKTYYIKLISGHGKLLGAQVLCDDTGAWQSQFFEIHSDLDEDEADVNMVSPIWNQAEVLMSLQNGEPMKNDVYEGYRSVAEESLKTSLEVSSNLYHLTQSKRPAA